MRWQDALPPGPAAASAEAAARGDTTPASGDVASPPGRPARRRRVLAAAVALAGLAALAALARRVR